MLSCVHMCVCPFTVCCDRVCDLVAYHSHPALLHPCLLFFFFNALSLTAKLKYQGFFVCIIHELSCRYGVGERVSAFGQEESSGHVQLLHSQLPQSNGLRFSIQSVFSIWVVITVKDSHQFIQF